jgi:hypothetical protein
MVRGTIRASSWSNGNGNDDRATIVCLTYFIATIIGIDTRYSSEVIPTKEVLGGKPVFSPLFV